MIHPKTIFIFFLTCLMGFLSLESTGQNTIGLLSKKPGLHAEGYNLFFPFNQENVYLTDSCGQVINVWEDEDNFVPGLSVYLLENGDLLKTKRDRSILGDYIGQGSSGEYLEIRSWDNELKYQYFLNNDQYRLHHDIEPLPNGNILLLAWEAIPNETVIELGRDPEYLPNNRILSESIFELNPTMDSIVWEWHAKDHLIQSFDPTKSNFGVVSENPQRIDINYKKEDTNQDWLHINSLDYNPVLDHILLSVPEFNEIWIIDHSTTTVEAAGSSGGSSNKGGDLLLRWGNPESYQSETLTDQKLFYQHDAHWTHPEAEIIDENFNQISLFNNRLESGSAAEYIHLEFNPTNWEYPFSNTLLFAQRITHPDNIMMASSPIVSSTQLLQNGNTLLFSGRWGYAYEISPDNDLVWEYRIPLKVGTPIPQGQSLNIQDNLTFRMKRYPIDFPGFLNKDLEPKGYLELEPNEDFCDFTSSVEKIKEARLKVYPNPAGSYLNIKYDKNSTYTIYNALGQIQLSGYLSLGESQLNISELESSLYFLVVENHTIQFVKN